MNAPRTLVAGLIGGIAVDVFLVVVRAAPFPGIYQFIASTVVGPVAYASPSWIALGLAMHFAISIAFAFAYAFAATRLRALVTQPVLWGAVFGLAVMIVMQIVLGVAHAPHPPPSVQGLIIGLTSHIVFFGIPVALTIAGGRARRVAA